MKISFTKMHGTGNDYIYLNGFEFIPSNPAELTRKMSPRRFSVGADGLVLILPSQTADAEMRMFNADGSEGSLCGNALRCVAKFLYDRGLCSHTEMKIKTASGIKTVRLLLENERVEAVEVDIGFASFSPSALPMCSETPLLNAPILVDGTTYHATCLSVGNPHCVVSISDPYALDLYQIGPHFEHHALFPKGVNTEFVRWLTPETLLLRVWERGSGETWSCGSGACAAVAAGVVNGWSPPGIPVTVHLRGGDLTVTCTDQLQLFLRGGAATSYEGVFEWDDLS